MPFKLSFQRSLYTRAFIAVARIILILGILILKLHSLTIILLACQIVSISFYKSSTTSSLLIQSFSIIILYISSSTIYTTIYITYLSILQLTITNYKICMLYSKPAAYCSKQREILINNNLTYFITLLFIALKYLHFQLTSAFIYLSLFKNKKIKNKNLFIRQQISIILLFILLPSYSLAIVFLLCL